MKLFKVDFHLELDGSGIVLASNEESARLFLWKHLKEKHEYFFKSTPDEFKIISVEEVDMNSPKVFTFSEGFYT
jgi:hypothetical protein